LLDGLHDLKIPEPVGGFEDVMDYDRRRMLREQLVDTVIESCLEVSRAARTLGSIQAAHEGPPASEQPSGRKAPRSESDWEPFALQLEAALGKADVAAIRRILPGFIEKFQAQPLLFVPMSAGGHPRQILASRQAQSMLRFLLERLPRFGLIRETYHLIKLART